MFFFKPSLSQLFLVICILQPFSSLLEPFENIWDSGYAFPFIVVSRRAGVNSGNAFPFFHSSILLHTQSLWGYILLYRIMQLRIFISIFCCVQQILRQLRKCNSICPFVHPSAYPISVGVYLNPITHGVFDHQLLTEGGVSRTQTVLCKFCKPFRPKMGVDTIRIKSNCEQIKKELGQKNLLLRNDKQKKIMFIFRKIAKNRLEQQL